MTHKWLEKLKEEENNQEFSQLVHDYFKLATMRVMQEMREKYNIPANEVSTILVAIWARFFNEAAYATGAAIKNGMSLYEIFDKEQLFNILDILTNQPLNPDKRKDIDIEKALANFKGFIVKKSHDFYLP